jgi:hypothetical protein
VIFFSSNYAGVVAYVVESSQELLITTKVDLLAHILLIKINFVLHIVSIGVLQSFIFSIIEVL